MYRRSFWHALVLLVALALSQAFYPAASDQAHAQSQPGCQTFSETGKSVCGRFLQYWNEHGGLAQQGFPISAAIGEVSGVNGKTYTVQYFERAVFELHAENKAPNDVLLSLLGSFAHSANYPQSAPNQTPDTSPGSQSFPQTGKHLGGDFLAYWQGHGALTQQGYPISEPFVETSKLDGKPYTVQYFERAVFELHADNHAASRVLLSQLGTFRYQSTYGTAGASMAPPLPVPPAIPSGQPSQPAQPAPKPTSKPAPGGQPTQPPQAPRTGGVTVVSPPGTVSPGQNASVTAQTTPNTMCSVDVIYKSGSSRAQGLYDKQSDASGLVSWTWKVGTRTTPGSWPVYITCNGSTATTYVDVR